jgi:hypothetical protein
MKKIFTELSIKGKMRQVPAIVINNLVIIRSGKIVKTATIKDEWWSEAEITCAPEEIIARLKKEKTGADLFEFSQKVPHTDPKYDYCKALSSVAAIPITSYADWWEHRLSQVTRKNVRRAQRRGVVVKSVEYNDRLIEAIVRLNNSTPIRQQRMNLHYGKSFDAVKTDYSEYSQRSEFLGAFFENEMIGLLQIIRQGDIGNIMHFFCMPQHDDKRPANALLASAVELCANKNLKYLVYGKFIYGHNVKASLAEFKRRNGFEEFFVPTYYIPLTVKGRIVIMLNMHRGIKNFLPKQVMQIAFEFRNRMKGKKRLNHKDDSE